MASPKGRRSNLPELKMSRNLDNDEFVNTNRTSYTNHALVADDGATDSENWGRHSTGTSKFSEDHSKDPHGKRTNPHITRSSCSLVKSNDPLHTTTSSNNLEGQDSFHGRSTNQLNRPDSSMGRSNSPSRRSNNAPSQSSRSPTRRFNDLPPRSISPSRRYNDLPPRSISPRDTSGGNSHRSFSPNSRSNHPTHSSRSPAVRSSNDQPIRSTAHRRESDDTSHRSRSPAQRFKDSSITFEEESNDIEMQNIDTPSFENNKRPKHQIRSQGFEDCERHNGEKYLNSAERSGNIYDRYDNRDKKDSVYHSKYDKKRKSNYNRYEDEDSYQNQHEEPTKSTSDKQEDKHRKNTKEGTNNYRTENERTKETINIFQNDEEKTPKNHRKNNYTTNLNPIENEDRSTKRSVEDITNTRMRKLDETKTHRTDNKDKLLKDIDEDYNTGGEGDDDEDGGEKLLYKVEDNPPWFTCIVLGLQHYLMMVESTVSIPYLLTPLLCLPNHHPARALIASTIIFVSGLVTFVQTTFGIRLPIVQGGTHGFLGPILSILALLPCPPEAERDALTEEELTVLWTERMTNIQGAICIASLFQVLVGATGAIGVLLRWITPLVIVPTISLIGFSLYPVATDKCASNWGVAALTIMLLVVFSQYLGDVPVPVPSYSKGSWSWGRAYVFKLIPVVLAVGIAWAVSHLLTVLDVLPVGDAARTDGRTEIVHEAPWFRMPYPCQWGMPQVTVAGVIGVLAGVLASIVESIGDYYACARLAGAPPPPPHAINRGIFTEGVGTFVAGLFGTGSGTTSYSQNIGAIAVTKVGSRRVIQYAGAIMLVCGLVGKVGAVFIIIPEPIIGGIFVVVFSMITSVGLSALQHVKLNSPRNLFVLGFSLFTGLALPMWLKQGTNKESINTGLAELDQVLLVLMSTSMFVGGMLGFILDNTIPGSDKERGVEQWKKQLKQVERGSSVEGMTCYDLPFGMTAIRRWSWPKLVPILPTFKGWNTAPDDRPSTDTMA